MSANARMKAFFKTLETQGLMVTYDDVRLRTHHSNVLPTETDVRTRISKRVSLNIPVISSPMDTVTTGDMAIAMAEAGGLGIVHRGLPPDVQAKEVARVKNRLNARVDTPYTLKETDTLAQVLAWRIEKKIPYHTFLIVDQEGKMTGMLARLNFRLCTDVSKTMREIMIPLAKLETRGPGCTMDEAYAFMLENLLQPALPLLNQEGFIAGMYAPADLGRILSSTRSGYNTDQDGHLRVGAAVGVGEGALARAELLADKKCDIYHVDTAHGDSGNVMNTVTELKKRYPHVDVLAGNVSSGESARRLVDAGADGVMVGQGPGSICTTRVTAGVGVPQVSAVFECAEELVGTDVPICADGGINNSGDIVIALAVGAESVMLGRLLAGTDEAPGETRFFQGMQVKDYRGMGSLGAMRDNQSSRERYGQSTSTSSKLVPEGIEGIVPYKGSVHAVLDQYVGGVRSGLGYHGARTLAELAEVAVPFRISGAGLAESHPHDVTITAEAPNYSRNR